MRWLVGLSAVAAAAAAAEAPDQIGELSYSGAPSLALEQIQEQQPEPSQDLATWLRLEKQRFAILRLWGMYQRGLTRQAQHPDSLPAWLRRWSATERVHFLLLLGQADEARLQLQQLIARGGDEEALQNWRNLVIRSYLLAENIADARIAFAKQAPGKRDPNIKQWLQIADLSTVNEVRYQQFLQQAEAAADGDVQQQARQWLLVARTAAHWGSVEQKISSQEEALIRRQHLPAGALFRVSIEELLARYEQGGRWWANRHQLLEGQDDAWLELALRRGDGDTRGFLPLSARCALVVFVARHGKGIETRQWAMRQLAALLLQRRSGEALIEALFFVPGAPFSAASLSLAVRQRMLTFALENDNIELAGQLLGGLSQPPAEQDAENWQIYRARMLLFSGRIAAAVTIIAARLEDPRPFAEQHLDRWLQLLFDLQNSENHHQALLFLALLQQRELPPKRQRELLFWRADSHRALHQYSSAAAFYLRSAGLGEPRDPWGHSARYRAAEMLAEGGMKADARRVYQALLAETQDAKRRSLLRYRLQALWLVAPKEPLFENP